MTTKQLLPPGSDKDFAVVHSTLTDSKVTAELLAGKTDRPLGSKYRIPLLGEARRIGHTLDTLDRIKARHDALVAALEQTHEYIKRPDIDDDAHTSGIVAGLIAAALEAAK